jgi:hypothetical protein
MAKSKEAQFGGVKLTIVGVVVVLIGIWVHGLYYTTYTTQYIMGYPVTYPSGVISLSPLGWLLIIVGAAVTILGIWKWTSNI